MKINGIFLRVFSDNIDDNIRFYEELFGEHCQTRFKYENMKLELAQVGKVLIICGSDEALKPFKETKATFTVEPIEEYKAFLLKNEAKIIRDITEVPTGMNMTVEHKDGTIIEYVEFKK